MSEWGHPDGLTPAGEQLEIPWDGPRPETQLVETIVHRVTFGPWWWTCACGAGRKWGKTSGGIPRGAARRHMLAVAKRVRHGET